MKNEKNVILYIINNNDILKKETFSIFNRKRLQIDVFNSIKIYGLYICFVIVPYVMTKYCFIAYKRWPWSKFEVMKTREDGRTDNIYLIYDYMKNYKDAEKRYNNIITELL